MYEGLRVTWICSCIQKNTLGWSVGTYIIYIHMACGVRGSNISRSEALIYEELRTT